MNTHAVFKNLVSHGFTEQQAEGITEAVHAAAPNIKEFVTKEQFNISEKEAANNKTDIHDIKNDIVEMKTDIAVIKLEICQIKDNMATKSDLKDLKVDMLKWFMPCFLALVAIMFSVIGLIVTR